MKVKYIFPVLALLIFACGKKTRYCTCSVSEVGTKTSITSMSVPLLVPGVGDTIVENYVYHSTRLAEYKKVSKKNMRVSCPVRTEEPIYDRTVSGIENASAIPGVPVGVQLIVTTENKGTRTRNCEITE